MKRPDRRAGFYTDLMLLDVAGVVEGIPTFWSGAVDTQPRRPPQEDLLL